MIQNMIEIKWILIEKLVLFLNKKLVFFSSEIGFVICISILLKNRSINQSSNQFVCIQSE